MNLKKTLTRKFLKLVRQKLCLDAVLAEDCVTRAIVGCCRLVPGQAAYVESRVTAVIVVLRSCSGKAVQPLVPWSHPQEGVH